MPVSMGASLRSDPQGPISHGEQQTYALVGKRRLRRRLPRDGAHVIEAEQSETRTEPETSIGRLSKPALDFSQMVPWPAATTE